MQNSALKGKPYKKGQKEKKKKNMTNHDKPK